MPFLCSFTGEMSVGEGAKTSHDPLVHPFILQSRVQQPFWASSGLGILKHKTACPSDPPQEALSPSGEEWTTVKKTLGGG